MRGVLRALVILQVLLPLCAFAADEKVLVELNSIESADNRCRLNFVVEIPVAGRYDPNIRANELLGAEGFVGLVLKKSQELALRAQ